ncbi:hypothetical protein J5754_00425 [bacterium]|nr:hypothetical protein [bacterium]
MKENDYSKNWKPIIRWRHRLAAWGFTRLKPTEPYESYYVYGKYTIPPERIPHKWKGRMNEDKERKLRFKAYQEACEQYKRDGYWKEKVRVSISEEIEIYKNIRKYVSSHPSDVKERQRLREHFIVFAGSTIAILFALIIFSIFLFKEFFPLD